MGTDFNALLANGVGNLKKKDGTVVVQTGTAGDINRLLRVESIKFANPRGSGQSKEVDMEVTIKRLGKANAGHTSVKKFPITVELDASGKVAGCHSVLDSKEHGIKTRMCNEMGGVMVSGLVGFVGDGVFPRQSFQKIL